VNVASRIGDYARPGEVLISRAVRDAYLESTVSRATSLEFTEIGPVELKGLAAVVELLAVRAAESVP
jgi:class 3 adenylate cyclase